MNGRIIGLTHRRKQTVQGETRPSEVVIKNGDEIVKYELATETDELDFLLGRFPTTWRKVTAEDTLEGIRPHHVKWKKTKTPEDWPEHLRRKEGKKWFVADKVPTVYDGICAGDQVYSTLGGSGDRFNYALAKQPNVSVWRLPPFVLKDERGAGDKKDDARLLVTLAETKPELFRLTGPRDLALIKITEVYQARQDAMKARIACEQRLYQRLVGQVFLTNEGGYPEGLIEDIFDEAKANDKILLVLQAEEAGRIKELTKLVEGFDVYREILEPSVKGCGPLIAARLIVAIGDIRRFATVAKFRAYCGVHVLSAEGQRLMAGEVTPERGTLARKRSGAVANWQNDARQAFWMLADQQFNRRPDSIWGEELRRVKAVLRAKHPEPVARVNSEGKTVMDYTDGHIHKMAVWRTATRFATWLYRQWRQLEKHLATEADATQTQSCSDRDAA